MTNETLTLSPVELTTPELTCCACAACGFAGEGFLTIAYREGDFDTGCPKYESTDIFNTIDQALHHVIDERDVAVTRADAAEASNARLLGVLEDEREDTHFVITKLLASLPDLLKVCGTEKIRELIQCVLPLYNADNHDKETGF